MTVTVCCLLMVMRARQISGKGVSLLFGYLLSEAGFTEFKNLQNLTKINVFAFHDNLMNPAEPLHTGSGNRLVGR